MIKILYVDDEPDISEVACMALEIDPEFEVRSCNSGPAGIEIARGWTPDLILLDVMMPGMDGLETFGQLKEYPGTREIPVVFITAKVQPGEVGKLLSTGAKGVLAKPFDPMRLTEEVRTFFR